MKSIRSRMHPTVAVVAAAIAVLLSPAAAALDWSGVEQHEVTLFYPGQASWEWALTQADHSGAKKFREGKDCRGCHEGEQADMGKAIVAGDHAVEPAPLAGKPGVLPLQVQVARDVERLYFRLRFKPTAASGSTMSQHAAHVTVLFDDGSVREATRAGCWAACHDDAIGMASAGDAKRSKYLGGSRTKLTRQGGGDAIKPAAELDAMRAQGQFLEYWQALLDPGRPAQPVSGYILDARHTHDSTRVAAQAEFADGHWIVTLSRPLSAAQPGEKALAAGKTYSVGFAVHDDYSDHRHHYVSLEYTLQLDSGKADFVAKPR